MTFNGLRLFQRIKNAAALPGEARAFPLGTREKQIRDPSHDGKKGQIIVMTILMVGRRRPRACPHPKAEGHSPRVQRILCAPGNGGIACDAECYPVSACDIPGMVALAKRERVDLVVVAPDDPLAAGMVDALEQNGIRAFGPNAAAARDRGKQGFFKRSDEKARHSHRRLRGIRSIRTRR